MTAEGDPLESVRISNDVELLSTVMARAGEAAEVVVEAIRGSRSTRRKSGGYGWVAC